MKKIIFLLIFLLLFPSCDQKSPKKPARIANVEVYFSSQTDIPAKLVSLIDKSKKSIHLACYEISLPSVVKALSEARRRKIDVKIVTDDQTLERNIQAQSLLRVLKIKKVIKSDKGKSALMHHKFIIIDREIVWTGSFNITVGSAYRDDNNVIVINSPQLAKNFEAKFERMWGGDYFSPLKPPYPIVKIHPHLTPGVSLPSRGRMEEGGVNGIKIETYFSPNGGCEEAIIKRLNQAKKSICFATFVFTNRRIANTIVKRFNQGIKVRGIMEREGFSPYYRYWLFKDIKADVKWDNNFYLLHHKFFIIDNKILITGSYNPTRAAEEKNEENILIIQSPEICQFYQEEFERLW